MDGIRPQRPLSDSQLDRDIESALRIEPSPEFVARTRARIAAEPEPSRWRLAYVVSAFRWTAMEPLWGVAIAGIVLAIVVPQLLRPTVPGRQVAELNHPAEILPLASDATKDVTPAPHPRAQNVRRSQARSAVTKTAGVSHRPRTPTFEERVLLAPYEREAFARLLTVVNDSTIELIAPILESTRAGGDTIDASVIVPVLAASEGVAQ